MADEYEYGEAIDGRTMTEFEQSAIIAMERAEDRYGIKLAEPKCTEEHHARLGKIYVARAKVVN